MWWQSLLFAAALIASTLGSVIAASIPIMVAYGRNALMHPNARTAVIVQIASYVVPALLIAFVLPLIAKRPLRELGFVAPRPALIGWGIAGAITMLIVVAIIGAAEEAVMHTKVDQTAVQLLKNGLGVDRYLFALLAVVVAPMFEESVFRGFLFNAFERYWPTWAAVLASAIFFGLVHTEQKNPTAVLPLIGGGAVLGVLYARTRALTATMIAHGTFNAATVIAVLAGVK